MKIAHPVETSSVAGTTGVARPAEAAGGEAAKKAAAAESGTAESATVNLSSTASSLLSATAEFDAEKVAAIRKAIAEGSFKPNPGAIADKLIGNARELLGGTQH